MGKLPPLYSDTETDNTSSSVETFKKKRKSSILKYTAGNVKKKKCKMHTRSDPDDSDYRSGRSRSQTSQRKPKLRGILKHSKEKEPVRYCSSSAEDEEESEEPHPPLPRERCLVGRVPHPAGSQPGRGGGLAIIVRKNVKDVDSLQVKQSTSRKKRSVQLSRKRSY